MNLETVIESKELLERWSRLRREDPRLAQRDGAEQLGVTEAELVAAHVGRSAVRLAKDWELALKWLGALGPATGLTRGAHAALEQHGTHARVQIEGSRATVDGAASACTRYFHAGTLRSRSRRTHLRVSSGAGGAAWTSRGTKRRLCTKIGTRP